MPDTKPPEPVRPDEFRAFADAIKRLADAATSMFRSGLTRNTLVMLLHCQTRVPQRDIKLVLDALERFGPVHLTADYMKQAKERAAE